MRTATLHTLLVALVLVVATWFAGPVQEGEWVRQYARATPVRDASGREFKEVIDAEKPAVVLIGNSVLDAAIDPKLLGRLTGLPTYKFAIHGSASALWYLMAKEVLQGSGHKPRILVLAFRDLYLTVPEYRVTDPYRATLNYFDRERDPLLVKYAYDPPTEPMRDLMRHHWSLYQVRGPVRESTESALRERAIAALLGVPKEQVLAAVDRAFAAEALDADMFTQAQAAVGVPAELAYHFDFEYQVGRSFLPHIVRMAKDAGVQLVCLRLRCRRETTSAIAANGLSKVAREMIPPYIEELAAYLEARDVPLIDMNSEDKLQIEHFADGDHLEEKVGRPLFTRLLAERLRGIGPR